VSPPSFGPWLNTCTNLLPTVLTWNFEALTPYRSLRQPAPWSTVLRFHYYKMTLLEEWLLPHVHEKHLSHGWSAFQCTRPGSTTSFFVRFPTSRFSNWCSLHYGSFFFFKSAKLFHSLSPTNDFVS
jgi:hypothetical protein